jgi:hypothetical protein
MRKKRYRKFVFGETLDIAIESLPEEYQFRFYRYIKNYGLYGIEPELEGLELPVWVQMKTMIDNTMPKQNKDVSEARSEAGKRGMAKRWGITNDNKDDKTITKTDNDNKDITKNNKTDNVNVNDNVNDNVNYSGGFAKPPDKNPSSKQKSKKPSLRDREPANDMERIEKAYLQNWDVLFSQEKVKTTDPIVNWNQTRALLKRHFENLKPDLIIQAINDGAEDDWVLDHGYSLGVMLSAEVLNRLINSRNTGPPEEYKFGEPSEGAVDIDALYNKFGLTGTEAEKRRKLIELRDQGAVSF